MMPVENTGVANSSTRIDLYRITVGANHQDEKLEVLGVYLHTLATFLPVKVIKTILKDEFEPEDMRLLLSRRLDAKTEALDRRLLRQVKDASLSPLRSEKYGAPPQQVIWHFFAVTDADPLMVILRKLEIRAG